MKLINYKKYIKKYLYIIEIMSHQIKSNNEKKVIIKENHKLYDLLDKHYVKKGEKFTHYSMGKPMGTYYIPKSKEDQFF